MIEIFITSVQEKKDSEQIQMELLKINSNFKISENVYTAKKMLETKGVTFPPPTPKEVKAQQGIK